MTTPAAPASVRIAANVRAEMGLQNMKPATLARRTNIHLRTVYRLINGERRWEAEDIEAVSAALGLSWTELTKAERVAA